MAVKLALLVMLAMTVMLGLPSHAAAQSAPAPGVFAPLPPIGLPLPQIALPLPQIGLPPAIDMTGAPNGHPLQALQASQGLNHRRIGRRGGFRSQPTIIYLVPSYGWSHSLIAPTATATPTFLGSAKPEPKPLTGRLRLDVQPREVLQVFVDGYYVGTPDDLGGALELEAGPHRIEINAPAYEALAFDVKIEAGRAVTYRGKLTVAAAAAPIAATPAAVAGPIAPAAPTTFYVIPGCYVGNVAPEAAGLPPTCDQGRVTTFTQ